MEIQGRGKDESSGGIGGVPFGLMFKEGSTTKGESGRKGLLGGLVGLTS